MPVSRITQRFVDDLVNAAPPAKDEFYWSERMPGFGLKRRAGSGSVSFVIQWRDASGSRRLALGDARKLKLDAAEKAARERFAEVASGRNPLEERRKLRAAITFTQLLDGYRDDARDQRQGYLQSPEWLKKSATTQVADLSRIDTYLRPALGGLKVNAITSAKIDWLYETLCDPERADALAKKAGKEKKAKRGGEGGARRTMRLLKAILAYAVKKHGLAESPATRLDLGTDGERDAVPDLDAYGRLWAALEELRGTSYTMGRACDCVSLVALTGARKSEIQKLRWRHVDLAGRRLVLPRSEHKAGRKTGKTRVIALPAHAVAILAGYLPKQEGVELAPDALVFSGNRPEVPVALQRPWEKIAEKAKLPASITLHNLRHGVGTMLAAEGKTPAQLAMALGHAQWRTTERYVHAVDKARADLAEQTAALVRPNKLRAVGS